MPPARLLEDPTAPMAFLPAPEVLDWLNAEILLDTGSIHNPEHRHLLDADLRVLWASAPSRKMGRAVIGTAEEVAFRCSLWQKARQEQQMREWFGYVPDYLITLDASYCVDCSDTEFCALVEHEMFHIGHKTDEFGAPAFTKDGRPKLYMRDHDVSEFVGVVRRYGVGPATGHVAQMVRAANAAPEVAPIQIAHACGACMRRVA